MIDRDDLLKKLAQIEEQAAYTLADFPQSLTKSRLRMILAITRYLRTGIGLSESLTLVPANERHESENDESTQRNGLGVIE